MNIAGFSPFLALLLWSRVRARAQKRLGVELARKCSKQLEECRKDGKTANTYFLVRHGESEANVVGIISSDPKIGTKKHGLSEKGKEQAAAAGQQLNSFLVENSIPESRVFIHSSDFTRARETAETIHSSLRLENQLYFCEHIRERFFGEFEGKSNKHYDDVWNFDKCDAFHNEFDSESVAEVAQRAFKVVLDFEKQHSDDICVIVAHGDLLQILRTVSYTNIYCFCHSFHI
mmetsp:Transcript_6434/g.8171  ORF Transcript_6434/g.8171 Transcript_6434/m.8171 type:complete len:232 (+) Transcript_6434:60-755(+)